MTNLKLIVCINQRLGAGTRSCVGSGNLANIAKIRELIASENLTVEIVERECLGKCEQGPIMRIAPGGRFFTDVNTASLNHIIHQLKEKSADDECN